MTHSSLLALPILAAALLGCAHEAPPVETPSTEITAYRAIGQEPGWSLDIMNDRLALELDYGDKRLEFTPKPEPVETDGATQYNLPSNGPESKIIIYHELCADVMSGMNYPDRVQVMVDGQPYDGCGGDPRDLLTGGAWVVEDLNGGGVIDRALTSLLFDEDGRVSGNGGCNQYSAAYELTGEGVRIGPIGATKKACVPALMSQEMLFFDILTKVTRFDITDDGALMLYASDQRNITARR